MHNRVAASQFMLDATGATFMSKMLISDDDVQRTNRAEAVPSENDNWIWAVIFTTTALTALSVAALFTIAAG